MSILIRSLIMLLVIFEVTRGGGLPNGAEPKTATDWFRDADDLTNIRMPGSAPFHMKVTFQAFPGIDFAKPGQSTIVTGDGTYEETWTSPEKWRREVAFGSYHAVEVRANGVRKVQASSDYEPSRVLMLLDALLDPVPRTLTSRELIDDRIHWQVQHMSLGGLAYIQVSAALPTGSSTSVLISYVMLPDGILVRSQNQGLVTTREADAVFGGKEFPRHLTVQAMGRNLLVADVAIEEIRNTDSSLFVIPGQPADAGTTLRPLQWFDVKGPQAIRAERVSIPQDSSLPRGGAVVIIHEIIDRHGTPREAELISAPNEKLGAPFVAACLRSQYQPAVTDGSPCEVELGRGFPVTPGGA
jgi:hypothetical protein